MGDPPARLFGVIHGYVVAFSTPLAVASPMFWLCIQRRFPFHRQISLPVVAVREVIAEASQLKISVDDAPLCIAGRVELRGVSLGIAIDCITRFSSPEALAFRNCHL